MTKIIPAEAILSILFFHFSLFSDINYLLFFVKRCGNSTCSWEMRRVAQGLDLIYTSNRVQSKFQCVLVVNNKTKQQSLPSRIEMGNNCETDYSGKSYPLCIPRLEETLQGKQVSILILMFLFRFLIWIGRVNIYLFVLHILECWIKAGMGIDHVEWCGFVFLSHSIILGLRELTKNIQSWMPLQVIRLES